MKSRSETVNNPSPLVSPRSNDCSARPRRNNRACAAATFVFFCGGHESSRCNLRDRTRLASADSNTARPATMARFVSPMPSPPLVSVSTTIPWNQVAPSPMTSKRIVANTKLEPLAVDVGSEDSICTMLDGLPKVYVMAPGQLAPSCCSP